MLATVVGGTLVVVAGTVVVVPNVRGRVTAVGRLVVAVPVEKVVGTRLVAGGIVVKVGSGVWVGGRP